MAYETHCFKQWLCLQSLGADEAGILMMADGCGQFALAMGVEMDLTEKGMGIRSRRYSMIVDNLEVGKHSKHAVCNIWHQHAAC